VSFYRISGRIPDEMPQICFEKWAGFGGKMPGFVGFWSFSITSCGHKAFVFATGAAKSLVFRERI
jgi:hypothetical protein